MVSDSDSAWFQGQVSDYTYCVGGPLHLARPLYSFPQPLAALMKVILWLLHPDPKSRAKLSDLRKDGWVNQPVDIAQYSFDSVLGK